MTKLGDIYQTNTRPIRFFQLVGFDETQLGSEVIAVLKGDAPSYPSDIELSRLIASGAEFFTHAMVAVGLKDGSWKKIASGPVVDAKKAIFKVAYYKDDLPDIEPYEADNYHSWVIWAISGKWKQIGSKIDKYPDAELGMVYPPEDILYRIEHGEYPGVPYYGQVR